MKNPAEVEFKIFPRLFALAENAWGNNVSQHVKVKEYAYKIFKEKAKSLLLKYFDKNKISYCRDSLWPNKLYLSNV